MRVFTSFEAFCNRKYVSLTNGCENKGRSSTLRCTLYVWRNKYRQFDRFIIGKWYRQNKQIEVIVSRYISITNNWPYVFKRLMIWITILHCKKLKVTFLSKKGSAELPICSRGTLRKKGIFTFFVMFVIFAWKAPWKKWTTQLPTFPVILPGFFTQCIGF